MRTGEKSCRRKKDVRAEPREVALKAGAAEELNSPLTPRKQVIKGVGENVGNTTLNRQVWAGDREP